jgi:serine O-acetyltransferase
MATGKKKILTSIKMFLYGILCIPHLVVFYSSRNKKVVHIDTLRWLDLLHKTEYGLTSGFIFLLSHHPEFRNLFYYRVGPISNLLNITCRKMSTLYITTEKIGEGLFIQHGFATVIAARSIGKNCWINQQVTIGFSNNNDCPVLEDNVTVNAGAKVIGGITIGKNSHIGANAVVVKNVPENCVVFGVPEYIIKRNGIKVKEAL